MNRVSIYSIREKILLNNTTRMMIKLTTDAQTKVIRRFHREIPSIDFDGPLIYCFYITIQNLIHLNVIYILFYHTMFWLDGTETKNERIHFIEKLENTKYEQTLFIFVENNHNHIIRPTINVRLIDKYIYITLIGVSTIELIVAFIWTLQKKLSILIQRNLRWRNRLRLLMIGMILIVYFLFIAWLFYHTFITHYLTIVIFIIVLIHFIILTILDKPNLFRSIPSIQFRKVRSPINSFFSSIRWSSLTEQKFDTHECSTIYAETRKEANDLWIMVIRRIALKFYRTFASFIFFDLIPYKMMNINLSPIEDQGYKILIIIFMLTTFLTHSVFLFPVQFQTNLHRLSMHLGQWRLKSHTETDLISKWSSECNSYTNGNVVRLSSNNFEKYFMAIHHLSNAAHPLSISHSILYRLFGNLIYFLTIQFRLCSILILCQFLWIIPGRFNFEIFISILIILNSSYTIFKIIRDRLLFDMLDEHRNEKKIQLNK